LISAPAGYGKTSFCKWSALQDGENFTKGESDKLPVYVPLYKLSQGRITDFESTFLAHGDISGIVAAHLTSKPTAGIKLYLDGLDEISGEKQRQVIGLARQVLQAHSGIQIVVTAREHVAGPWLSWLPRVHISELNDRQVRDLVSQLLNHDDSLKSDFFRQLAVVPSLGPLLRVPLLCTLTMALYTGSTSLPEGKNELYRIFVDLMCGGWDAAKGIKRESQFPTSMKLRFLIRLASTLHNKRVRIVRVNTLRKVGLDAGVPSDDMWESFLSDVVSDGLLIRDGDIYAFSHFSFQEYLCARDIADPATDVGATSRLMQYFRIHDDWWQEVMIFYAGMTNRPDQLLKKMGYSTASLLRKRNSGRLDDGRMLAIFRAMFPTELAEWAVLPDE